MKRLILIGMICMLMAGTIQAEGRYRDIFIGNKPAGFAGAFIGLADDCNAAWYNPAGMVHIAGSSIGTSPSFEAHANGRTGSFLGADEGEYSILFVPTALGSVSDVGPGKLGLGLFMPVKAAFSQTTTASSVTVGPQTYSGFLDRSSNEETFYMGVTYAYPITDQLSVGGGAYYVSSSFSHNLYQLIQDDSNPQGIYADTEIKETAKLSGFTAMASMMFKFNDDIKLGASLWTQTTLGGTGLYRQIDTEVGAVLPFIITPGTPIFDTGQARQVFPANLGIGASWRINESWLLVADLISHFGTSYRSFDSGRVDIEPVLNYSIGAEWRITPQVPLRFGLFSNLSYFPGINNKNEPQNPHVDVGGLTVGCGYEGEQNRFFGGLKIGSGAGKDKILDLTDGIYKPVDATSFTIGLFLGMNYNF